jgi:hypothetical protein
MTEKCRWCGMFHESECPRIKSIEYYENGSIKKVELFEPNKKYVIPDVPISALATIPEGYDKDKSMFGQFNDD